MKTKVELTAPCGMDCFNCELYEENVKALSLQKKIILSNALGKDISDIICQGCSNVDTGCEKLFGKCKTLECVNERGYKYCFECVDFPCPMLQPTLDKADSLSHNFKIYNLSRMKVIGVEKWTEEATEIRKKYKEGKLVPGRGPVL